mgnify:CR=1 FL=1
MFFGLNEEAIDGVGVFSAGGIGVEVILIEDGDVTLHGHVVYSLPMFEILYDLTSTMYC